jgi:periplasmic protein CpxP/Spy
MQSNRLLTLILSGAMLLPLGAMAQAASSTPDNSSAQTTTTPQKTERGAKFAKELNLTPEQQTELKQIRQSSREQFKAIKNDSSLTADQKKAKLKELRQSTNEQMMSKLNPDQQAKFKEMRKEHRHQGRGHKGAQDSQTQR